MRVPATHSLVFSVCILLWLANGEARAQPCIDADGDGYGVYPGTSTMAGCTRDGIDCDDGDDAVHPFADEVCGNSVDDNCRNGADEGCGAPAAFDGWRVMPVRSQGQFERGELGGRAEQWLQGGARCIADPDVIYLSHDCSQPWRSRDGGQTWEKPLSHGLLLPHGQSIEVDPVDCNRVLAIVDNSHNYKNPSFTGIYLSEDGGEHWQHVQPGPTFHSRRYEHNLAFAKSSSDAQGALTWYAALYNEADQPGHADAGLYRSDDRGRTWSKGADLTAHFPVYEVQVSPSTAQTLFVASASGLFRSTDGGGSVAPAGDLPAGEVTSVAFDPADASVVLAVVRGSSANGLYRSENGGDTFVPVTTADTFHQSVLADARRIFVHATSGDVFYVLPQDRTDGRTAIRTDNGGQSFATTSISMPDDIVDWRWGLNFRGNFSFILMSAADSQAVVAQSGGAALYRSTDGVEFGNGSELYTGANCGITNYGVAFDRSDPQRMALGMQDIGMYLTENGGNWFLGGRGIPRAWIDSGLVDWGSQYTLDIHPTLPDHVVGVAGYVFSKKIVRTENAGLDWALANDDNGHFWRVAYHPFDPSVVYAGDSRSLNGGVSFASLPIPAALDDDGVQVMDYCRSQPDIVYTASRTSRRILRSNDRGDTWILYAQADWSLTPYDSIMTFAVDPVHCDVIYTVGEDRDLARFDGSEWQILGVLANVSAPDGYFYYVRSVMVDPTHPEVLYAGVFGAGIPSLFRSTDRGDTWEDISLNRFRQGVGTINVSPHSGEVMVGSCSGTWVLPPPYPTNHGVYDNLIPRPSCLDGIHNGDEGGIDCGGDCPTDCPDDPSVDAGPNDAGTGDGGPSFDSGAGADAAAGGCGCHSSPSGRGVVLFLLCALIVCLPRTRPTHRGQQS